MNHAIARSWIRLIVYLLGVAGVVALTVSLPAVWLAWETADAQSEAALRATAASARVRAALSDVFAHFDRATASLRAQDVQGDTVALTGRLLRAEPLVQPAAGLMVINNRGAQVASSTVVPSAGGAPVWWFHALPVPQSHGAAIIGCGTAQDGSGWILARGIESGPDTFAGSVASVLPDGALQDLAAPGDAVLSYSLRDANGCELSRGAATAPAAAANAPLVRLYRAILPARWFTPDPTVTTVSAGNLTWTGTISAAATLGARAAVIDRHAGIILDLVAAFGGVALLLLIAPLFGRRRAAIAAPVPATVVSDGEDLRARLDELAGERDRVLAAIGHDVRTPMNSILGICALLLDGDLDEAQRKWLRRIRASCETLLAMLNGMLEIAAARVDGDGSVAAAN